MTDVTPKPHARTGRLLRRAQQAHEDVTRLVEDLRPREGRASAQGAQESLSELCACLSEELRERKVTL